MWRRLLSTEAGIFLGIWLALMLFGRSALLRDPGTFWHTVVGEKILNSGQVVREDTFSFTAEGKPWVAQWWLAECGMAAVYRLSRWDGLLLVAATLLAGVYAWVASRFLRAGFHALPTVFVLALVLLASSHQFHVRPLLVTIVLLGVTFSLLVDVEASRGRLRRLWWFVPLVVLWANLHGGVLAGLGTVGLVVAGWCLAWSLGKDSPVRHRRDAIAMAAFILASGLAVLVNPYGLDLPRAWLNTLTMPLPNLIHEHGRIELADPFGCTMLLLGVGYLIALAGVFPKCPRATWLLPLVWFVLACHRVRHAPLFAITAAIASAGMLPQTRWANWLKRREMLLPAGENPRPAPDWRSVLLPLALVIGAMLLQAAGVSAPIVGRGWAKLDATRWPVDQNNQCIQELKDLNRQSPENTRIFNDLNFGGFLIFHAPRLRVFIDDRCALYGADFLQAYDRARREDPSQIDHWQQQYGFHYALVETDMNFDGYLRDSGRWTLIRRTPAATLYRRD